VFSKSAGLVEEIRALAVQPILIITDGAIENTLRVKRDHAFLIPKGKRLPFRPRGKVFYYD